MKIRKDETEKTLTVRLPERLLLKLKEQAVINQRSLNSEIVYILQQATETKKGK